MLRKGSSNPLFPFATPASSPVITLLTLGLVISLSSASSLCADVSSAPLLGEMYTAMGIVFFLSSHSNESPLFCLELVRLFAKKGNSLSLRCSYSVIANIRKLQHFIWCKMVSWIRCQPIIRGNSDQSIIKVGRTEMMNDFSRKMIRVWLKKLQLNDSGEYHLESHFQGRNKLLNRTMLEVLGELIKELMIF